MELNRKQIMELQYLLVVWGYNYIAKDKADNEEIYVYEFKPVKNEKLNVWECVHGDKELCTQDYDFISWEDEPINIRTLIQDYRSQERSLLISLLYSYTKKGEIYPPEFEYSVIRKVIDFLEEGETNPANMDLLDSIKKTLYFKS